MPQFAMVEIQGDGRPQARDEVCVHISCVAGVCVHISCVACVCVHISCVACVCVHLYVCSMCVVLNIVIHELWCVLL